MGVPNGLGRLTPHDAASTTAAGRSAVATDVLPCDTPAISGAAAKRPMPCSRAPPERHACVSSRPPRTSEQRCHSEPVPDANDESRHRAVRRGRLDPKRAIETARSDTPRPLGFSLGPNGAHARREHGLAIRHDETRSAYECPTGARPQCRPAWRRIDGPPPTHSIQDPRMNATRLRGRCRRRIDDRFHRLRRDRETAGQRRLRCRAEAAGTEQDADPDAQRGEGRRLAGRHEAGRRRGHDGQCVRRGSRPPALGLHAAERRRAGRRDQRAAEARRRQGHSRLRAEDVHEERRVGHAEREPHHAAARRGRRRRRRGPRGLHQGPALAVRHGAGRQSTSTSRIPMR